MRLPAANLRTGLSPQLLMLQATCMSVHGDVVYILMEGQLHKSEDAGEAWVLLGR